MARVFVGIAANWGSVETPVKDEKMDADAGRRVRESFLRQGLMQLLGAELAELRAGECEIRVRFREELTQQHGYFHAGDGGDC